MSDKAVESATETEPAARGPVIIDLGKQSAKKVKALRKGQGKLLEDVTDAVAQLAGAHEISADASTVIVVVERKAKWARLKG